MKVFSVSQKHRDGCSDVDERNAFLVQADSAEEALDLVKKEWESHGEGYEYDEVEEVDLKDKISRVYHWDDN